MILNLLRGRIRRKYYLKIRKLRRKRDELKAAIQESRFVTLLTVIGSLVIIWTRIERWIDGWVEHIHRNGGTEIQTDLPPSLDRELDYIKAALKADIIPISERPEAKRLLTELHRLKDFRHNLIHGIAELNDAGFLVDNWRVRGAQRKSILTPYSRERVIKNHDAATKLCAELRAFVARQLRKDASEGKG